MVTVVTFRVVDATPLGGYHSASPQNQTVIGITKYAGRLGMLPVLWQSIVNGTWDPTGYVRNIAAQ